MAGKKKNAKKKSSKKATATVTRSGLLALPPELWSQICRLAVVHDLPIESMGSMNRREIQEIVQQPAITRTCRTIRKESIDAFYSNTFIFADDGPTLNLWAWLQLVSKYSRTRNHLPTMIIVSRHPITNPNSTHYMGLIKRCQNIGIRLEHVNAQQPGYYGQFKVVPFATTSKC
ncbi:hypothetical protein LTR17_024428 [Elasticomyces elasticus]|nr:hypothetical protein LTR17_024428 [Elasticomyces elasticus]